MIEAEVDRLAGPGAADKLDFEALETAVRAACAGPCGALWSGLQRNPSTRKACPCGEARYAGRSPRPSSVLGPRLQRAYYESARGATRAVSRDDRSRPPVGVCARRRRRW